MLYPPGTGEYIQRIVGRKDATVKGVAHLISNYLNDDNVKLLLETVTPYDSTAQVGTGCLMRDTSTIRTDGYHFRFQSGEGPTCLINWGATPDELMESAAELVRRSPDRKLRDYWDQMRSNLSALASSFAESQGMGKDVKAEQWRMVGVTREDIDAVYADFLDNAGVPLYMV